MVPAQMPSRDDTRNDAATCPACGQPFTPAGRRRWCSAACRQAAWRRRRPPATTAPAVLPPPPAARQATIYQCPNCDGRYLGQQRCDECGTFCRRVGPGGLCPCCGEPIAVSDLITST